MSDEGNPETTQPGSVGKPSLPEEPEEATMENTPAWWPGMEESAAIMADYVSQTENPFPQGTPLPEDPDPGQED